MNEFTNLDKIKLTKSVVKCHQSQVHWQYEKQEYLITIKYHTTYCRPVKNFSCQIADITYVLHFTNNTHRNAPYSKSYKTKYSQGIGNLEA